MLPEMNENNHSRWVNSHPGMTCPYVLPREIMQNFYFTMALTYKAVPLNALQIQKTILRRD